MRNKQQDTVMFKRTDGKTPAKTPWGVNIRLPMDVTVPPALDAERPSRIRVQLGISCSRPLLTWPDRNAVEAGLAEDNGRLKFFGPDDQLMVELTNTSDRAVSLQEGTSVLRAIVVSADYDVAVE